MKLSNMPITALKGVGDKLAQKLEHLGISTVSDLLFHLPLRYEDRTQIWAIQSLLHGIQASVVGEIRRVESVYARRKMLVCHIDDGSGSLTLRFFNFSNAQKSSLVVGQQIRCFGEVKRGHHGWEIIHPEYRLEGSREFDQHEEALTPVYPTTEGLKQNTFRNLSDQALLLLAQYPLRELLPEQHRLGLDDINQAIKMLHRPPPGVELESLVNGQHPALQRLVLEEICAHQLSMLAMRRQQQAQPACPLREPRKLKQQFLQSLPFKPTNAQSRVVKEISQDLRQNQAMLRLVQGDVGSGKTLVAAMAAIQALGRGYQVALMAPTEILAEQHTLNFKAWLEPLGFEVDWLGGKLKGKAREKTLERVATGQSHMIVGTHAIFQDQVQFHKLALVIIDEQHRFGVHQRMALRDKGAHQLGERSLPHQLIMTATPIPRTLAMTAYADLELSVIDELPPGRTPITTVAIPDTRREEVTQRVHKACKNENRQSYWVCTLIEESESLQCQAAEDTALQLQNQLPDLRIGLVHGRMKAQEKQWVMQQFKAHELDVLVATTVIEVGVDVPNASLMIIENPERLGLAQLHQLRGRVGRGKVASHCVLMYHSPLSKTASARLSVLRESNDGFVIAQRDMELRGPGELLGTKQTGVAEFKLCDLIRDKALISPAQSLARSIAQQFPELAEPLIKRWVGEKRAYAQA
ncbi:ATP-dependent DNA helicase RecG [Alginatibacterium sediminis]|uniref:ATP-dependent DNA helicase RecG n=1 Tax=Alginatibacterium sediminis TaxID=2164068 RepID=A0A420E6A0_9ALTE|nr:ATP-dependent DNA helicase RecG [Alginatibacterium sediminis]RKF13268.1 ATP-dependent DNA helicase RecG [Alginatibacterium sediminis]